MKLNTFLDADIFLDSFLNRDNGEAKELLELIVNTPNINAFLSDLSIANIHYLTKKKLGENYTKELIRFILVNFKIIPINENVIKSALNSNFKDFKSALEYFASQKYFCEYIVTRNKKAFSTIKNFDIEVLTPKEFLIF